MLDVSKQGERFNAASEGKHTGRSWKGSLWGKQVGYEFWEGGRRGKSFLPLLVLLIVLVSIWIACFVIFFVFLVFILFLVFFLLF